MIYLDNSATTYPKPYSVRQMLCNAPVYYGANPGRGGYRMSSVTALKVHKVRELLAEMFGAESEENVVFTLNCTHALNIAIKGLAQKGGHAVTSCLEHNSVMRPLNKLKMSGEFDFDMAKVYENDEETVKSFESKIRPNTSFIVCTYASNVFGDVLPVRKIGKLAQKYKIPLIVDAAQAAGVIDIDMKRDNISCLCMPGHKSLYGPAGTGILILSENCNPETLMEGGTGSESKNFLQPTFLPDRFESGTQNISGILALGEGVKFVKNEKISNIRCHECELTELIFRNFLHSDKVIVYNNYEREKFVPILSFNIGYLSGEETASLLAHENIAVRGGFHCNPCAHDFYKTASKGTARVSFSVFNTKNDADYLIKCVNKIAKTKKV